MSRGSRVFEVRGRHSVLVAIVNDEPEAERFQRLSLDHEPVISCGTLTETLRVMPRPLTAEPKNLRGKYTLVRQDYPHRGSGPI